MQGMVEAPVRRFYLQKFVFEEILAKLQNIYPSILGYTVPINLLYANIETSKPAITMKRNLLSSGSTSMF